MNIDLPSDHQLLEQLRPNLPSPLLGKTGWPWTEGSPAADVMPDGSPWPRISIVTLDDVPGPLSLHNLTVLGTTSPGKPDRAAHVFTPPLPCAARHNPLTGCPICGMMEPWSWLWL